ncbi:TPR domain-containing protein [Rhizophagus irregularis DAOM 181602=DAOM 197198]|nr:TPR domain-containing protein [Rhizophagus irregularis DAOM 181602=DAOM 197198]
MRRHCFFRITDNESNIDDVHNIIFFYNALDIGEFLGHENDWVTVYNQKIIEYGKEYSDDELIQIFEKMSGVIQLPVNQKSLPRSEKRKMILVSLVKDKKDWHLDEMDDEMERAYGYSMKNVKVEKSIVFVRGKQYTILPALTLDGFIAADFIEGSCNKERFQTFILTQVLPQMNEYPNKNSVIVMDNANFSSR